MAKNVKDIHRGDGRIGNAADVVAPRSGLRAGDAILVMLAILLVAALIFLASVVLPAVRETFREFEEDILMTVEFPMTPEQADTLPKAGDIWILLDSDSAPCSVRSVNYSEENALCRVVLLCEDTLYREREGYSIAGTRIAVGAKLYFRRDPEQYFAATVTGLTSDRFEITEVTTSTDTDGIGEEDPNG